MATTGYLGNPKLRRAHIELSLTQSQVEEYFKCVNDPVYFIRNYVKIVALGRGIIPFELYPFQEEMVRTFEKERFVICKIPRQSGKTITTVAYLLHTILFNENYNIAILAHKGQAANGILARLKLAYENLPQWLQSGIIEWNKGNIELENGSKIGAFATSSDGLRSGSYDCITGDSIVKIKMNGITTDISVQNLFETFEAGTEVETTEGFKSFHGVKRVLSKSELIHIILENDVSIKTTPDHLILTEHGWMSAKSLKNKDYVVTKNGVVRVHSLEMTEPEYVYDLLEVQDTHSFFANSIVVHNCILLDEFAFVSQGIAEEFFTSTYPVITAGTETKIIIVSTPKGMNHFFSMWVKAEKGLSDYKPIEVHWSAVPGRDERWKEETIRNTSEEQFQQEFLTEFIGSSHTLISSSKIKQLMILQESPIRKDGVLDIYEEPVPSNTYCMTVDVAEGQGLDYSTFSIIDVTQIPYKMVAKYRNNKITPLLFPTVIYQTAKRYNDAFVLVEINSIGLQVSDILHHELAYENLIKIEMKGKQGQQHTPGFKKKIAFGLKTNKQTKAIGCANLKTLIESDKLLVRDEDTIKEFTTFVVDKQSFKAEQGNHDDLAMTLVHFGWLTSQRYFKENINSNIRTALQQEQMNLMDADLVPFGLVDNGVDDPFDDPEQDAREKWIVSKRNSYTFDNTEFDILSNKHRL